MMKRPVKDEPEKVDIHAVAAQARVSIATVSRTLNHVPTVNGALASRVWKAVSELNYLPNTQARALVSGKSRLLGLIVSEITNPFFPELIQEFERIAVEHGYEILIASTGHDPKKMQICLRRMLERKVDGVAVMTFGFEEMVLKSFEADKVPAVFIDIATSAPGSSSLSVNYKTGIYEGVQHLAVLGHRRIGFITGPLHLNSSQARKAAFLESMRSTGLRSRPEYVVEGDHTLDGGRDAMQKVLQLKERPTAILCSNDMTAIGVQHALFDAQLKVPEDFSLIGFDDIHLAEYTIPPLTTVRMSGREIATKAIRSLLSHVQGMTPDPEIVETRLVVRQTTGFPRDTVKAGSSRGRVSKSRGKALKVSWH